MTLIFWVLVIGVPAGVVYLLGLLVGKVIGLIFRKSPRRQRWEWYGRCTIYVAIPLWVVISLYLELHPQDVFYLEEFNKVVLRAAPPSSKVVAKSASLFSLRDEYCAYSRIEMSSKDYSWLLSEVENDPRFVVGAGTETDEQKDVWDKAGHIDVRHSFEQKRPGAIWQEFSVNFLEDGRHVEVNSCVI